MSPSVECSNSSRRNVWEDAIVKVVGAASPTYRAHGKTAVMTRRHSPSRARTFGDRVDLADIPFHPVRRPSTVRRLRLLAVPERVLTTGRLPAIISQCDDLGKMTGHRAVAATSRRYSGNGLAETIRFAACQAPSVLR